MKPSKAPATGITTALIYTRVSSDEQAREGVSLDAQLADCRRYASAQGWVLGGEYQDILSGARDDRPKYQALLAAVRRLRAAGQPAAVVVARLDRFGRRVLERVRCREELKSLGIPTHSVREGGEVSDLVANILASVAEDEVRRLGERVSDVKQHLVQQGWFPPGKPAWGYALRSAGEAERAAGAPNSILILDPATAPYAREAYRRVAAGESIRSIARWARALPPEARGGREMAYPTLRRMLRAPVYIARPQHGPEDVLARPVQRWEPLVKDQTWLVVQRLIADHLRVPHQASGGYLLTGLLRCPACGSRMNGVAPKRRASRYRCSGHLGGASMANCRLLVVRDPVDAAVMGEVTALVDAVAAGALRGDLRRAWQEHRRTAEDGEAARQVVDLERIAAKARERLTNAATLLVDGALDRAGYEGLRDREMETLDRVSAEIARLQAVAQAPVLPEIETVLVQVGGWATALRSADVRALRQVLTLLIERVTPHRVGRGMCRVEIAWSQTGDAIRALAQARQSAVA